jgi:hypothetical protein
MVKVSNREVIDVVRYADDKAIIVEKKPMVGELGKYKVSYFVLNFDSGNKEVITKNAYLLKKFGPNFQKIIDKIGNFVQCETQILPNRNVLVVFENGQVGLFDDNAELVRDGLLSYNDKPVCGIADGGETFWSCCREENCVIRYFSETVKVDIRIGSKDAETFANPHCVSSDNDFVYVCCDNSRVRKIDKSNFTVTDVNKTYSDLQKYYKFGDFSIICTSDSAYIDKD